MRHGLFVGFGLLGLSGVTVSTTGGRVPSIAEPPPAAGAAPAATLTITPSPLFLSPGRSATLAAVVKDASGNLLPNAGVKWVAAPDSVVTVTALGVVTAKAAGTTVVGAELDSLKAVAVVAVLDPADRTGGSTDSMLATRCGGIGAVRAWGGYVHLSYARAGTTSNITVEVQHDFKIEVSRLGRTVASPDQATWEGPAQGGAPTLNDQTTDRNQTPMATTRMRSRGPFVSSDPSGRLSWVTMSVDLKACTMDLLANPHVEVLVTGPAGDVSPGTFPIGELRKYGFPVAGARMVTPPNSTSLRIPAHSFLWAAVHLDTDVYLPAGFGPMLFAVPSLEEPPEGEATLFWAWIPILR